MPLPETNLSCSRAPSQTPPARHNRTRTQTDGGGGTPRKSLGGVQRACLLAEGQTKATHTPPPPKPNLLQNRGARTYPPPPHPPPTRPCPTCPTRPGRGAWPLRSKLETHLANTPTTPGRRQGNMAGVVDPKEVTAAPRGNTWPASQPHYWWNIPFGLPHRLTAWPYTDACLVT